MFSEHTNIVQSINESTPPSEINDKSLTLIMLSCSLSSLTCKEVV